MTCISIAKPDDPLDRKSVLYFFLFLPCMKSIVSEKHLHQVVLGYKTKATTHTFAHTPTPHTRFKERCEAENLIDQEAERHYCSSNERPEPS